MGFLLGPWHRWLNRSELARTRRSLERRLNPLERALDQAYCDRIAIPGRTVHLIAGLGSSGESILELRTRVLPAAVEAPDRWLFLVQEGAWGSEIQGPDQYSVVRHVAQRLQIPLVDQPFLPMTSEVVIAATDRRGLPAGTTEDDLYGALCYDHLPKPGTGGTIEQGLRSGEIHGVVHPRWEATRIRRELAWAIDAARLVRIVTRVLERIAHNRAGALDEYYEHRLRDGLRATALKLNGERMHALLQAHPTRDQVLLLLDEAYLPVLLPALGGIAHPTEGVGAGRNPWACQGEPRPDTVASEFPANVKFMNYSAFIEEQIADLRQTVGDGVAINAMSGGVDSSVVTVLAHRALGKQLKTILVDNALMREGELERVVRSFADLGIPVELLDARREFLDALKGVTDPEAKRQAITQTFYRDVFAAAVRASGARYLLHGTILTDIEETVAGIKRQHNILAQLGIDPESTYGYRVLEPLKTLRKDGVREVARLLG